MCVQIRLVGHSVIYVIPKHILLRFHMSTLWHTLKLLQIYYIKVVAKITVGDTENNTFKFVRLICILHTTTSRITGHRILENLTCNVLYCFQLHNINCVRRRPLNLALLRILQTRCHLVGIHFPNIIAIGEFIMVQAMWCQPILYKKVSWNETKNEISKCKFPYIP